MANDKETKKPTTARKKTAPKKKPAAVAKKMASDKSTKDAGTKQETPKRTPLAATTFFAKPQSIPAKWRLVDATGLTLGRLSSYIATALMGKDKPSFTRFIDTGDFVVVINCEKIRLTGNKLEQKFYKHHTGYVGGVKSIGAAAQLAKHPDRIIKWAVHGMLPSGHMGRQWFKKLKVYVGESHPHQAQRPEPVALPNLGMHQ